MKRSHGFNSVDGRMLSVTPGASAANRDLTDLCSGSAALQSLMEQYR